MYIDLFIHNTTEHHESRWVSVINPATGYAVRSPFQHPFYKTCEIPCIQDPILPSQRCEFHQSCCRLDHQRIPYFDVGNGARPIICLHLYADEFEKLPAGFLDYLQSCNPLFVDTLTLLFLTGIELSLSTLFQQQLKTILANPSLNTLSPIDRDYMEMRAGCFGQYANKIEEFLGQLARFYDINNETGTFLPRPGREPQPELNILGPHFSFLKVASWLGPDTSTIPWPTSVMCWPDIGDLIRRYSNGCSFVPWASGMPITAGNTLISVEHLVPLPTAATSQNPPTIPSASETNINPSRVDDWPTQVTVNDTPHKNDVVDPAHEIDALEITTAQASTLPRIEPNSDIEMDDDNNISDSSLDAEFEYDPDFESSVEPQATSTHSDESSHEGSYEGSHESNHESSDDSSEESSENSSDNSDGEETYAIEALVSHRPPIPDRSKAQSYKVRWAGSWPKSQKETWEPAVNIAVDSVDRYWADLESGEQRRGRSARTRREG